MPYDAPPQLPPRPEWALVAGVASPEWLHVAVEHRIERWSGGLSLGTQGMASTLGLFGRYFPFGEGTGAFVEGGLNLVRMNALTRDTPQPVDALGFVGVGWRATFGPLVTSISVGPAPMGTNQTLFGGSAAELPRVALRVGTLF